MKGGVLRCGDGARADLVDYHQILPVLEMLPFFFFFFKQSLFLCTQPVSHFRLVFFSLCFHLTHCMYWNPQG